MQYPASQNQCTLETSRRKVVILEEQEEYQGKRGSGLCHPVMKYLTYLDGPTMLSDAYEIAPSTIGLQQV